MIYFLLSQDLQSLNKMNTPSADDMYDEIYDEIIYDDYTIIDPIPIEEMTQYEVTLKLCTLYKGVPYGPAHI